VRGAQSALRIRNGTRLLGRRGALVWTFCAPAKGRTGRRAAARPKPL